MRLPAISPKITVSVVFVAALFMSIMDTTIINVALPAMGRDLHADVAALQWTVDAYTLAFAALLPSAGVIGDRLGARGAYLAGFAWGMVTRVAASSSWSQSGAPEPSFPKTSPSPSSIRPPWAPASVSIETGSMNSSVTPCT